ncbi:AraC family transcriptional regulator [Furfurilactobacillus rossiae]|uniref:AraC family transcriptional regulator n=1 Tax=Furfurilactobacillus rossiae DSM 15814 TaxID=1114972 RepID=A0A0R1RHB9_9LACO|nr:AraC family transcriptional regulator [Furfurilactobacillus rossiae]KRL53698.1 AraC family transcriptional regulator [Furfurilactobacillus rossiae DSM 15814]QFR67691.1 helix-turn-helix domain-containing protein [Furfurilactobacillus rossiae]QLE60656.1 AraC-like transcriptional regulator HTH and ligand binding domain [Furfurilactobacillus rossiae]
MTNHYETVIPNLDIGVRFYESKVNVSDYVPFHWHNSIELVCVLEGKLTFTVGGKAFEIGPNQFMIVSSGVVHDVTNTPNHAFVLQIPLDFISTYVGNPEKVHFQNGDPKSKAYQRILELFIRLNRTVQLKQPGYLFDCGVIILLMIKILILDFSNGQTNEIDNKGVIKEIIAFIDASYSKSITLSSLASQFGYNASYLSRLFKRQTGITLGRYLYSIRLSAFHRDLTTSAESIEKLYEQNGLRNPGLARKLYKQTYGVLPHKLR